MKIVLTLLALTASAFAQTLQGFYESARFTLEYQTPWQGTFTVYNEGPETLTFSGNSNPPPYTAGFSLAGGDLIAETGTEWVTVYTWGTLDQQVKVNGWWVPLHTVPEPSVAVLALGSLVCFRRTRR